MSVPTHSRARHQSNLPASENPPEDDRSFFDHLEELRWHLIRSLAAIMVFAIGIFVIGKPVFEEIILAPKHPDFISYHLICQLSEALCFGPPDFQLETRQLGEQFIVHIKTSFFLGLILAFPYVFWEFWKFLRPGLLPSEKRAVRGVVLTATLLFYIGVAFGYFVIAPFAITFLAGYDIGAVSAPTLASYTGYMTMFTLPTGIVFQMPLVIFFLSKLGLITATAMRQFRRQAFVVFLVVAAIITPPDGFTQLLIAMPLYALFEISIIIARREDRRREKELGVMKH